MDPFSLTPEEQQQIMAQALRSQTALRDASAQGGRFDNMAAIAQLANNKAAAQAAAQAAATQQARFKPNQLGTQGFAIPGSGAFVASPMFLQDKMEARAQGRGLLEERNRANTENQAARLFQSAELARERAERAAEREKASAELKTALATMADQTRRYGIDQNTALRGTLAQITATAKAEKAAQGKTLPFTAISKLNTAVSTADSYGEFANSWKDDYSGTPVVAGIQNTLGRYAPGGLGYADQSNWWQKYNEELNKVRKELFGSALTKVEKDAFEAANIAPGMDPIVIRTRLAQQAKATARAAAKIIQSTGASGYDVSGFQVPDVPSAPATVTETRNQGNAKTSNKVIKLDSNLNVIQ